MVNKVHTMQEELSKNLYACSQSSQSRETVVATGFCKNAVACDCCVFSVMVGLGWR